MEIEGILTEVRKQYLDISTRLKNQCPFHLKDIAGLELSCINLPSESSKQRLRRNRKGLRVCCTYRDLFATKQHQVKEEKQDRKAILIEGEAGIGKSILCTSIIDDWASGRHFQEFWMMLLLPLCHPSVTSAHCLVELFNKLFDFDGEKCSCIMSYLRERNCRSKILIIADGWDQLHESEMHKGSLVYNLLFGNVFPNSSVNIVITSRPACIPNDTLQFIDQFATIKRFDDEMVRSIINSEFGSDKRTTKYLIEQLENNPLVDDMCRVPLNLAIICNLCHCKATLPLPYTMTEMFAKITWNLARISLSKTDQYKDIANLSCHHDLPEELLQSWWFLCKLAFENKRKSEDSTFLTIELSKVSHFGLLKSVSQRGDIVFFSFLHPVIKEYLAALHFARQPALSTQLVERCATVTHRISSSTTFWRFFLYVGKILNVAVDNIIHAFQLLTRMHHCSNDDYYLYRYAFEAKSEVINREVVKAISSRNSISGDTLLHFGHFENSYDFMAVSYVIEHIEHQCSIEINFRNCNLTAKQVFKLGEVVGSQSNKIQVKGLNLSHNKLGQSVVDFFGTARAALQSLKKLFLVSCGIGMKDDGAVMDTLMKFSRNLTQIDMSFNPLSISCLKTLQKHINLDALVKLEIFFLKGSLPKGICMTFMVSFTESLALHCLHLRRLDLAENNLGEPGNPELCKMISLLTHPRRDFDLCLNDEYMHEVDNSFIGAMQECIRRKGKIDHTIAHGIFIGPGRSGKNTLMSRLMGERPPDPDSISPSTGVLESIIKVEVKKMCTVANTEINLKWERLEYDEEALELMMNSARYYSAPTPVTTLKPNSGIKYIVKEELQSATISKADPLIPSTPLTDTNPCPNVAMHNISEMSIQSNDSGTTSSDEEEENKNVVLYSADVAPVDIFKKALKRRHMDGLREHLESSWSLYLTNTGGQPEFQENLPILVCGPSIFFVTFPLHYDLNKHYDVQYQYPRGRVKTYQSTTTLMEEILQLLATISALDCTSNQRGLRTIPKVFLVGTHRDKLPKSTADEMIKEIDEQLQKCIKHTALFKQSSIQFSHSSNYKLIFTVNNLSEDDDDFQKIRSAVQETVDSKKHSEQFTVTCPSTWLIFSLVLRAKYSLEHRFLSFDRCFDIAQECGISDRTELRNALSFIHSSLGLVRYFTNEEDEELKNLVVIDPQVLFDAISELIVKTLDDSLAEENEIEDFQKGIIRKELVERISERCGSDLKLPFTWLAKLLNYVRIAALFTDHDGKKYFFPSVLSHAPKSHLMQAVPPTLFPPLLIAFEGGFCPRGISGALIKYLMTNEMKSKRHWKLLSDKIFRNQVSFAIETFNDITLRILPTHLEICYDSEEDEANETCEEAYKQIEEGMRAVTTQYIKCDYFFGFYCMHIECKDHHRPAKIEWHRKEPSKSKLKCTIEDHRQRGLPKGYEVWNIYNKRKQDACAVLDKEIDYNSGGVPKHMGRIADLLSEWDGRIAEELLLKPADVAAIRTQFPTNLKLQSRAALQQWKQKLGSGATYNKLISVFERAGYKNYADEVRKIVSDDNSDSDSSGNEDSALALPQPPTFPHLSLPSPIQLPPDLPEHSSHETFYLIDSAISNNFLEEGDDYIREIQHSHNITIVPMLSSEPGKDEQAEDMDGHHKLVVNDILSHSSTGGERDASQDRQGTMGDVTDTTQSKTVGASGADSPSSPTAVTESMPHDEENKRDGAEVVEKIMVNWRKDYLRTLETMREQYKSQMQSLESRHKNELTTHYRDQERELESLWTNYEKELERLRSKLRQEANQKLKDEAKQEHKFVKSIKNKEEVEMKQFYAQQTTTTIIYKRQLEDSGDMNSAQKKAMLEEKMKELAVQQKIDLENHLQKLKTANDHELVKFRQKAMQERQSFEKRLLQQEVNLMQLQKDQVQEMRRRHLANTIELQYQQLQALQELRIDHLNRQHAFEWDNQLSFGRKADRELKKKHILELKEHPVILREKEQAIKKQYNDTVKIQHRQYRALEEQIKLAVPRDRHKEVIRQTREERMRKISMLAMQYERTISDMAQQKTIELDEAQLEEQEIFRKKIQREQDLLQKVQESQEAKQLVQHDREKQALDEEVEADKKELQKQIFEESTKMQNMRLERQQDLQKKHMRELGEFNEAFAGYRESTMLSTDRVPLGD